MWRIGFFRAFGFFISQSEPSVSALAATNHFDLAQNRRRGQGIRIVAVPLARGAIDHSRGTLFLSDSEPRQNPQKSKVWTDSGKASSTGFH